MAKSKEYLEEALRLAKDKLPGWAYAQLVQEARSRTGGRSASVSRTLSRLGLTGLDDSKLRKMTQGELADVFNAVCETYAGYSRGSDKKRVRDASRKLISEMMGRGMKPAHAFVEEMGDIKKAEVQKDLGEPTEEQLRVKAFSLASIWDQCEESPASLLSQLTEKEMTQATVGDSLVSVTLAPEIRAVVTGYDNGLAELSIYDDSGHLVPFGQRWVTDAGLGDILRVAFGETHAVLDQSGFGPGHISEAINKSLLAEAPKFIPLTGPEKPKVVFLSFSPSKLEAARGRPFVGEVGRTFEQEYLKAFGLGLDEVALGFCVPTLKEATPESYQAEWGAYLASLVESFDCPVVAVGKQAVQVLGDMADLTLPHPAAIYQKSNTAKMLRKSAELTQICRKYSKLDVSEESCENTDQTDKASSTSEVLVERRVQVQKAEASKQIVYGVVLDPYEIDAHGDWVPPSVVEQTAHNYLRNSQVIGLQHTEAIDAKIIESFVEMYPTQKDYDLAMANERHTVSLREFGSDVIKSGSWVLGVQLGDKEWQMYQDGQLTGFSIGARTSVTPVSALAMPEVEFVRMGASHG